MRSDVQQYHAFGMPRAVGKASVFRSIPTSRLVLLLGAGAVAVMLMFGCENKADAPEKSVDADADTSVSASAAKATGSPDSLSEVQRNRLAPSLRRFLTGDTSGARPSTLRKISPAGTRDGENVYAVLIEGAEAEILRQAGIPYVSVAGSLVTARLTTGQIRKAASVEAIRKIRLPKRARTQ
jgi:hypothetical protein